jgi:hypothetical protein
VGIRQYACCTTGFLLLPKGQYGILIGSTCVFHRYDPTRIAKLEANLSEQVCRSSSFPSVRMVVFCCCQLSEYATLILAFSMCR